MMKKTSDNSKLATWFQAIEESLAEASPSDCDLRSATLSLSELADGAAGESRTDLSRGADLLSRLLELAICWQSQFTDDPHLVGDLIGFVQSHVGTIKSALESDDGEPSKTDKTSDANGIDEFIQWANETWGEYLMLIEGGDLPIDGWELASDNGGDWQESDEIDEANDDEAGPTGAQIELMLSALSATNDASDSDPSECPPKPVVKPMPAHSPSGSFKERLTPLSGQAAPATFDITQDRELLEAYLDDAIRCVGSMEQAALAIEETPSDKESVQQFCRELHTLKGASATVGLSELASYLHDLETSLEALFAGDTENVETDALFVSIDRVRTEISLLQTDKPLTEDSHNAVLGSVSTSPTKPDFANLATHDDSSVRIRASNLDRLMDMLAELVVLRNRRENHVAEFNSFNSELARCAARLSLAGEQSELGGGESAPSSLFSRNTSNTVSEVSKDIAAVSRGMRELQEPVSHDNAAISIFIRDFRQELMQLRRVPVSGLFRRLQRAARDVAKTENKQVQVKVIGENTGLEQEIQERLFESLLHIVRNSVSHGIETAESRLVAGKPQVGMLTLEAFSTAQLLTIEVHDDGNGLNYEAIRERAISKGLLSPIQRATDNELARLIFHPGFSTREQASEISGRGVGMDIVAKTIESLQGRIEVDSVSGQGTTIRLLIPLRTGIEHVMVFRSDGQLFALPMQAVTAAKTTNSSIGDLARLSLSSASNRVARRDSSAQDVLLLNRSNHSRTRTPSGSRPSDESQLALAVDELVGPEEVVVRGLPNLLKHHPLFCGVTLSGSGEKVLLLDSERVEEFCQQHSSPDHQHAESERQADGLGAANKNRVLIVDDSLTVRRALVKMLQEHDFVTSEAGDGIEAIERLQRESFDLVLTDLDMPRLGGLELLSDIQAGRYCDAPVVVISSRDEETFRMQAMDAGAIDYIAKPVSNESIAKLLEGIQLLPINEEMR